jgi:hypothetical protein
VPAERSSGIPHNSCTEYGYNIGYIYNVVSSYSVCTQRGYVCTDYLVSQWKHQTQGYTQRDPGIRYGYLAVSVYVAKYRQLLERCGIHCEAEERSDEKGCKPYAPRTTHTLPSKWHALSQAMICFVFRRFLLFSSFLRGPACGK